jgi:hypothetical protein
MSSHPRRTRRAAPIDLDISRGSILGWTRCPPPNASGGPEHFDGASLPRDVAVAWRQRRRTKPQVVTTAAGEKAVIMVDRIGYCECLTRVRALYLDLSQWAIEDPARWRNGPYPAQSGREEVDQHKLQRHRKSGEAAAVLADQGGGHDGSDTREAGEDRSVRVGREQLVQSLVVRAEVRVEQSQLVNEILPRYDRDSRRRPDQADTWVAGSCAPTSRAGIGT